MILQARQRPSESITIAPTTPFVSILYDKKKLAEPEIYKFKFENTYRLLTISSSFSMVNTV